MADRPILFSAPMVQALIDGRKTQTRRVIETTKKEMAPGQILIFTGPRFGGTVHRFSPSFAIGDRLYVREEYYQFGHWEAVEGALTKGGRQKWSFVGTKSMVRFEAPGEFGVSRNVAYPGVPGWYKRLGRFMPRNLSRMTLIVTDVRVERLQDCSEADAVAEGIVWRPAPFEAWSGSDDPNWPMHTDPRRAYRGLWNTINGAGAWEANPWVVAISFIVTKENIDG